MGQRDDGERPLRRKRIGIKDVAKAANVSPTAVSYALNGTGRLDAETRKRVIAIAAELGYRANHNARRLRNGRTGVIAIAASVRPSLATMLPMMDYLTTIWQAAAATALARGYMLLLLPFGAGVSQLANVPLDGGIVVDPIAGDPMLDHFDRQSLPVVTIGQDMRHRPEEGWWVDNDHEGLTRQVLDHLTERGARRIGAILADPHYEYTIAARRAIETWSAEHGVAPLIASLDELPTESAAYNAALKMLADREAAPDAIFAHIDRFAVGTMFAAAAAGYVVPRDLMIVSGNDGPTTSGATVPITALDLGAEALGRAAVEMLIDRIEQRETARRRIIPGRLIVRLSTEPQQDGTRDRRRRAVVN
ncbi:LacI family DNA-binding transcriptional regulator [Acuticoccus kandeliae]|uniref:LacI family DNA-binding transcriptional regulator n=1 Tax=Acuticoccus kandeliae TaxID=2073160 RepID=UPI000D3E14AF|nr:LacI family DNA-binding transcriptional regulator [Acuticoccus kandeliae]